MMMTLVVVLIVRTARTPADYRPGDPWVAWRPDRRRPEQH
jgi:hypothetical protein